MLGNTMGKKITAYVPDYVVFDLETTGISCASDEVIEISAVKVAGGQVVDEFSTLVNPGRPIPWQASRVNGIYDDMVAGSPDFVTALAAFLQFAGDAVLVGHNIHSFDMKFLYRDARRFWNRIPNNDYIDTLQLARYCLPQLHHHRLVDLAEHYGISSEGAHRALADCRMNQQVFELLGRDLAKRSASRSVSSIDDECDGMRICPKCGYRMVPRSGKFGRFYGCTGYPVCRHTEKLR
ncbi:MAG: topoisomerase DNA-binding C4 zinc finger domain-containing protein [Firmicutes bacterium]|nr:topoisomerase DNA-binding C4 zinc finger domain-containing protein [Bacillota bacterium]